VCGLSSHETQAPWHAPGNKHHFAALQTSLSTGVTRPAEKPLTNSREPEGLVRISILSHLKISRRWPDRARKRTEASCPNSKRPSFRHPRAHRWPASAHLSGRGIPGLALWPGNCLARSRADVIKIEHPEGVRQPACWALPLSTGADGENLSAAYYHSANARTALDHHSTSPARKVPDGPRTLIAHLRCGCSQNFKVGGLKKYGLDTTASKARPIPHWSMLVTWLRRRPTAPRAGYDFIIQAMTGNDVDHRRAWPRAAKGRRRPFPMSSPGFIRHRHQAALPPRKKTGERPDDRLGAVLTPQAGISSHQNLNYLGLGTASRPDGNAHMNIAPYE